MFYEWLLVITQREKELESDLQNMKDVKEIGQKIWQKISSEGDMFSCEVLWWF